MLRIQLGNVFVFTYEIIYNYCLFFDICMLGFVYRKVLTYAKTRYHIDIFSLRIFFNMPMRKIFHEIENFFRR